MKGIIVIIGPAYPYRGGIAAFNERLARQFVEEGWNVVLYTFTRQYPSFLFPGKTQFSPDPAPKDLDVRRRIDSINPINWLSVGREIGGMKADVVIFSYWMSFMAPCFGTIAGCVEKNGYSRCIGLIHNMIPHEQKIIDKILPGYFVNRMDAFAALSDSVLEDIGKFDRNSRPKISSPHPVYDHYGTLPDRNSALETLCLDKENRYVLFFGFVRAYKGLDLLLEAMADKRLSDMDIHLIVAGEFYEDSARYMDIVEKYNLGNRVHFFSEYIPDSKVKFFFGSCDIVAQPYRTATQSGVTQIAYHFGKPMLVTKVGGLSEIVPEGKVGYNVDPRPDAIADALADFYLKDSAEALKAGIQDEKKKYEWNVLTDKLKTLF